MIRWSNYLIQTDYFVYSLHNTRLGMRACVGSADSLTSAAAHRWRMILVVEGGGRMQSPNHYTRCFRKIEGFQVSKTWRTMSLYTEFINASSQTSCTSQQNSYGVVLVENPRLYHRRKWRWMLTHAKAGIPRHRHQHRHGHSRDDPRRDVGEYVGVRVRVGVVECQLKYT